MQELMLHAYENAPTGSGVYHCQHTFRLSDKSFSLTAWQQAVEEIVRTNPVLRTVLIREGDRVLQGIVENAVIPLEIQDTSKKWRRGRTQAVRDWEQQDRNLPFTAQTGQFLFRMRLFIESKRDFTFFMSLHHIIIDGWGYAILMGRLMRIYLAIKDGEHKPEPIPANSFREFVALEQEVGASEESQEFWKARLQRMQPRELSRLSNPPIGEWPSHKQMLNRGVIVALHKRQRDLQVSFKSFLLSAYLIAVDQVIDQNTVGVITNGRSPRLSDPLAAIGLYWNMIPFHRPRNEDSLIQYIRDVHTELIATEPHATYPTTRLMSDIQQKNLLNATFNYVNFNNPGKQPDRPAIRPREITGLDRLPYPLNLALMMMPENRGLGLIVEYDAQFFTHKHIENLITVFTSTLEEIQSLEIPHPPSTNLPAR
jgi:hypothetical protein